MFVKGVNNSLFHERIVKFDSGDNSERNPEVVSRLPTEEDLATSLFDEFSYTLEMSCVHDATPIRVLVQRIDGEERCIYLLQRLLECLGNRPGYQNIVGGDT